ncbi:MAG TPA: hypothetical protein VJP77_01730 [Planctomycetota bacterium]|nr:hypothetical protein [Planctomycetota bacterium]
MRIREKAPRGERGIAMVAAVVTVFSAGAMVAVLLTLASARDKEADVRRDQVEARYLAEGAAKVGKRFLQAGIANWLISIDSALPAGTVVFEDEVDINGKVGSYVVTTTGFGELVTDSAGIQTVVQGYQVQGFAQAGTSVERVDYIVNALATPIFQFAVFYTGDLEINPGADMSLKGRVHTNADLYLSPGTVLQMATNYVHAVGGIYRHRKDDPSQSQGTVNIAKWVENPFTESLTYQEMWGAQDMDDMWGLPGTTGYDSNFADGLDIDADGYFSTPGDLLPFAPGSLEFWGAEDDYGMQGYTVLTGEHGLGEAVTPWIESISSYAEAEEAGTHKYDPDTGTYVPAPADEATHKKGFYNSMSAFSIIMNEAQDDYQIFGPYGSETDALGTPWKDVFVAGGVTSLAQIYDAKQAKGGAGKIDVVEFDMAAFNLLVEPQLVGGVLMPPVIDLTGAPNDNGGLVLFAGVVNAGEGIDTGGLVVKNAADLPKVDSLGGNGGLTIVGETSVYLKGDFNTTNKVGAAVIADGANLLSNDWANSKNSGTGLPKAKETTFNVAMISGNYASQAGAYNGGLENLPRFHENWSGVKCNIKGSFVNAWESEHATGNWIYGSPYYTAPLRNWQYDTDFNNIANLPPFTPMAVSAVDVAVW